MADSSVEIWNMALAKCGSSQTISSETENSSQANTARRFYDQTRRFVLSKAPWGCALAWARLAVIAERDFSQDWVPGDPGPQWRFAYALPSGMLAPFYLMSYGRFELALHEGVPALMAQQPQAILRYVQDQTVVSYWDPDLTSAIVAMLAFNMVPVVNAKFGTRDRLQQEAQDRINLAIEKSSNETEGVVEALPSNVAARGYAGLPHIERYFHTFNDHNGDQF